ncbi:hypothetical protein VIGAN_07162000 [Vigna angularis var. angularis]|uniref:Uncharacterized protein n=1 Tax=Vigna angularis var. angularis TaxID=157739 RepID=A0A0S3SIW1_PHAAN|nr:hypothetical protein VIGAN_07162000 [Vigna angularis var. angularis]
METPATKRCYLGILLRLEEKVSQLQSLRTRTFSRGGDCYRISLKSQPNGLWKKTTKRWKKSETTEQSVEEGYRTVCERRLLNGGINLKLPSGRWKKATEKATERSVEEDYQRWKIYIIY